MKSVVRCLGIGSPGVVGGVVNHEVPSAASPIKAVHNLFRPLQHAQLLAFDKSASNHQHGSWERDHNRETSSLRAHEQKMTVQSYDSRQG